MIDLSRREDTPFFVGIGNENEPKLLVVPLREKEIRRANESPFYNIFYRTPEVETCETLQRFDLPRTAINLH